jgi:ABC-type transport system involved in multi-copper enzyme maturation permease subunit
MPQRKKGFFAALELPLVTKELNEQAARPRTYVVRFFYAVTLFSIGCAMFYGLDQSASTAESQLGFGREMFERLVKLELWMIYLVLPSISCSCLTVEKERNTLALLLLTALRPSQIVLQKLLGRVVPMIGFVLLSFPLMGVAYSFGGVTEKYLWEGILLLLITCIQTGALAIACSAYYSTTVEALIAHFVIFFILLGVCSVGWAPMHLGQGNDRDLESLSSFGIAASAMTVVFVAIAIGSLERRAFVPPRNMLLSIFKWFDGVFTNWNQVTGGVVLVKDGDPLPGDTPIAWRETAKKSLGMFRYLFRVLMALELPLLAICYWMSSGSLGPAAGSLAALNGYFNLLCVLATVMIVVHGASVISSERTRQTIDVLLACPLSGKTIVREKLFGVWRLLKVLSVPFVSFFVFKFWWNQSSALRWPYLILSILTAAIYMPLLAWVALWAGLVVRSQMKAILGTLAAAAGWITLPSLFQYATGPLEFLASESATSIWRCFNPALVIAAVEAMVAPSYVAATYLTHFRPVGWSIILNLCLHLGALALVRRHCLKHADRLLGRLAPPATHRRPNSSEPNSPTGSPVPHLPAHPRPTASDRMA